MPTAAYSRFAADLAGLAERGRYRSLGPARGIDFASNDYLALGRHPSVIAAVRAALDAGVPAGAGASRLLRGNHPAHEALEEEAAAFFGCDRALYLATGYLANFALMTALPQRGDLIVFDALLHASGKEGIHAGHARRVKVAHNDVGAVDDAIAAWRRGGGTGQAWIAVESLYSMDGDVAPLADLMTVADRHDAVLIVDEAHATGVHGPEGRGFAAPWEGRENLIALHTCGKGLGAAGALICAPRLVADYLVNACRPFIFTTAPSPLSAVAVGAALRVAAAEPERRDALAALCARAGRALARCGHPSPGHQILPVIVGADADAVALAGALQARGFDVRAIRPPTVPEGTARLRIAVTLNAGAADVDALFEALAPLLRPAPAEAAVKETVW
jgi:8-amino-7-oxononanoate synthase